MRLNHLLSSVINELNTAFLQTDENCITQKLFFVLKPTEGGFESLLRDFTTVSGKTTILCIVTERERGGRAEG